MLLIISVLFVALAGGFLGAWAGVDFANYRDDQRALAEAPKCEFCGVEPRAIYTMSISDEGSSAIWLCKKCDAEQNTPAAQ